VRTLGAILVIARFNPLKKIGPRFGRTPFFIGIVYLYEN
jgi:hypothetical protein